MNEDIHLHRIRKELVEIRANMRSAYDKGRNDQLKQVLGWLDDHIYDNKCVLCSEPECEWVNITELLRDLKIAMRPTTKEQES